MVEAVVADAALAEKSLDAWSSVSGTDTTLPPMLARVASMAGGDVQTRDYA